MFLVFDTYYYILVLKYIRLIATLCSTLHFVLFNHFQYIFQYILNTLLIHLLHRSNLIDGCSSHRGIWVSVYLAQALLEANHLDIKYIVFPSIHILPPIELAKL